MKRGVFIVGVYLLLGAVVNVGVAWGCVLSARPNSNVWRRFESESTQSLTGMPYLAFEESRAQRFHFEMFMTNTMEEERERLTALGYQPLSWSDAYEYWLDRESTRDIGILVSSVTEREEQRIIYFDTVGVNIGPGATVFGPPVSYPVAVQVHAGWPRFALYGERWDASSPEPDPSVIEWRHHWSLDLPGRWASAPLRPERLLPLRPLWPGFALNTLCYAFILWLLVPGSFALRRFVRRRRGRCVKCGYDLQHDHDLGCPECGWKREEVSVT